MTDLGFEQTDTDQYVLKKETVIIPIYVDDCIILSRTKEDLDKILKETAEHFTITDERNIETYLGTQIYHEPGFMKMSHPNLSNLIIDAIP